MLYADLIPKFFTLENTTIDDIVNIIDSVVKQNRDILVRIGNGRITQLYPK